MLGRKQMSVLSNRKVLQDLDKCSNLAIISVDLRLCKNPRRLTESGKPCCCFLENLRIYDGGEGKNQNLIEVQRQLRSKKYKDLDFKLILI